MTDHLPATIAETPVSLSDDPRIRYSLLFRACLFYLLLNEGGYVNDRRDPGGETKYGIAKRYHPNVDIQALTVLTAADIYYREYWLPLMADQLPPMLAFVVFDTAVLHGIEVAVRFLQHSAGTNRVDGIMGPLTVQAATSWDEEMVCRDVLAQRITAELSSPKSAAFALGWARRQSVVPFQAMHVKEVVAGHVVGV